MLELWPPSFNPADVRLIIRGSFIEMYSSREAFPKARILDRHRHQGALIQRGEDDEGS